MIAEGAKKPVGGENFSELFAYMVIKTGCNNK
jgi:hypothetical protein